MSNGLWCRYKFMLRKFKRFIAITLSAVILFTAEVPLFANVKLAKNWDNSEVKTGALGVLDAAHNSIVGTNCNRDAERNKQLCNAGI